MGRRPASLGGQGSREQAEPGFAVSLLRRVLAQPPVGPDRAAVLVELVHAEAAVGDPLASGQLERAVALMKAPGDRAKAYYELSKLLFARGDFLEAADAAEHGLAMLAEDDPLADDLLAALLLAASSHPEIHEGARKRMSELIASLATGSLPRHPAVCAVLSASLAVIGRPASEVVAIVRAALANGLLIDKGSHGMVFSLVGLSSSEPRATGVLAQARRRRL